MAQSLRQAPTLAETVTVGPAIPFEAGSPPQRRELSADTMAAAITAGIVLVAIMSTLVARLIAA